MTMYNNRFASKVAVVTGGASGIGLAIVDRLVNEGANVVVVDINQNHLNELNEKYEENILTIESDVTNEVAVKKVMDVTKEKFNRLDYAFNVAGSQRPGPIINLSEEDWDFTVDLCLKGVFLCMKHEALLMKHSGGGAIVNISSLNAHVPMYAGAAYSSAKAGVEMLTKNGALELAKDNIRINAILPGLVDTPLVGGLLQNEQIHQAYLERIPLNRAAKPEEIAAPALFLVSEDASYISGTSVVVDGAWEVSGYPDLSKFLS